MITKSTNRIIYGGLIHALSLREIQALPRGLIAISEAGIIEWIEEDVEPSSLQEVVAKRGWALEDVDFLELAEGEWIMPGFVDTHTHAPQFPNMGIGGQYELLDWLANITFPTEAKFADVNFAREAYTSVVQRVLNCGTTTCCYYGTLHLEATKILADISHKKGQRAFVGKCNMDRHAADTYQEESAEQSLTDTKALIEYIRGLELQSSSLPPLVRPILTPRFAITCSPPLLSGLGEMAAADPTLHIQTHISENRSEVEFTKSLFPECDSYAGVYDRYGLLRNNTILAHACLLEESELQLVREREAGISHCPTSNFHLRSGLAKVGEMLDRGIKVSSVLNC
ncbi:hypothetical protein FRC02_007341 [Tulasnella sp. 418]|nr:hypothetical protein FRC02_007341 [Tulasnella sp. 418]